MWWHKIFNPRCEEAEAGGSLWVWGQSGLQSEFQTNQGSLSIYIHTHIKIPSKNKTQKARAGETAQQLKHFPCQHEQSPEPMSMPHRHGSSLVTSTLEFRIGIPRARLLVGPALQSELLRKILSIWDWYWGLYTYNNSYEYIHATYIKRWTKLSQYDVIHNKFQIISNAKKGKTWKCLWEGTVV